MHEIGVRPGFGIYGCKVCKEDHLVDPDNPSGFTGLEFVAFTEELSMEQAEAAGADLLVNDTTHGIGVYVRHE